MSSSHHSWPRPLVHSTQPPLAKTHRPKFPQHINHCRARHGQWVWKGREGWAMGVCVCVFCDESRAWVICLSAGAGWLVPLIIQARRCGLKMKYLWMAGKPVRCKGKCSFTGSRRSSLTAECHSEGDLMPAVAVGIWNQNARLQLTGNHHYNSIRFPNIMRSPCHLMLSCHLL